MANLKRKLNEDPNATGILEETPEQKNERNLRDKLDDARRKELRFEQIKKEEMDKLTEYAKEEGSLRRFRESKFDALSPQQMQEEIGDIEKEASRRALLRLGEKEAEIIPYSSKLKEAGAQGELVLQKLKDAGIDVDNLTEEQVKLKLDDIKQAKQLESSPKLKSTPMQDMGTSRPIFKEQEGLGAGEKSISEPSLNRIKNLIDKEKTIAQKVKTAGKLGVGGSLGALSAYNTLSDIKEGNLPEAAVDVAETGLSLAGKGAGRFVPILELLRSTEPEPKDDVTSDIPMVPHRFKKLKKLYNE